jgi:hypothetical protein
MERLGGAVDENNVSLKRISHPGAPADFHSLVPFRANPGIKPECRPCWLMNKKNVVTL